MCQASILKYCKLMKTTDDKNIFKKLSEILKVRERFFVKKNVENILNVHSVLTLRSDSQIEMFRWERIHYFFKQS